MLRRLDATRYVTPLREGGSLPAIVEGADGQLYVLKFVGAGQGKKALIAELLAGELARVLGLPVPELVLMDLDPVLGRSEPNPEIRDLIQASAGLNLGMRYLDNALIFNAMLAPPPDAVLASAIVWFDAYITNVDRTARNVNMLIWRGDLWLIDHGAALYFHHAWSANYLAQSRSPFAMIKQHTLLSLAGDLDVAAAVLCEQLTRQRITDVVALLPEAWLGDEALFANVAEHRAAYVSYLCSRLEASSIFVEEAIRARSQLHA